MTRRTLALWTLIAAVALAIASCGGERASDTASGDAAADRTETGVAETDPAVEPSGTLRLYTSVTQDTVDAVVAGFRGEHGEVEVEVFRAPTGELTARIAAEQRDGGITADVLWLTDPLSMHEYAAEGLLREWTPDELDAVPEDFREQTFWGTRILNMVVVAQAGLDPTPTSWRDLADRSFERPVAVPDPGFAGSAFGALAFFGLDDGYGFDYYRALADNGGVQVNAPGEVVTGVAEGRYSAGMTLDKAAREAIDKGSPIEMGFPDPGAVAIYSPIAVVASTENPDAAEAFANYTLTREAQAAIAETGWQPVRADVDWPHGGPQVHPDWQAAFERREELLEQYRAAFGG